MSRLDQGMHGFHAGCERDAPLPQEKGDEAHETGPVKERQQAELLHAQHVHPVLARDEAQAAGDVTNGAVSGAGSQGPVRCRTLQVDGLLEPRLEAL